MLLKLIFFLPLCDVYIENGKADFSRQLCTKSSVKGNKYVSQHTGITDFTVNSEEKKKDPVEKEMCGRRNIQMKAKLVTLNKNLLKKKH